MITSCELARNRPWAAACDAVCDDERKRIGKHTCDAGVIKLNWQSNGDEQRADRRVDRREYQCGRNDGCGGAEQKVY